jgi:plastocyanin
MKSSDTLQPRRGGQRRSPVTLAASALLLLALVVAACGQAAPTASESPAATPTSVPVTQPPAAAPSETPASAAIIPSVTVANQAIVDGKVTIAQVVSAGPGWLVIHAQTDGAPGLVLGYSPVKEGDNADVVVLIDATKATATLYAMLHSDAGTVGTYEFPGSDGPMSVDGQVVTPAFAVTGGLAAAPTPEPSVPSPSATPPVATPPVATGSPTVAVGEGEVELEDFQFVPKVLTVKVGTTVKFSNKDRVGHTVTSDTGLFDSGMLGKGDDFFFTFTKVGEYPYYCAPHGGPGGVGMSGLIIVVP